MLQFPQQILPVFLKTEKNPQIERSVCHCNKLA